MQAYKKQGVVSADGSVTVQGLPLTEGQQVEVIVLSANGQSKEKRRSLLGSMRGSVLRYDDPFGSALDPDELKAL